MKVGYFAFSETFGAPNAGFVHTYNIVKNLAETIEVRLFIRDGHGGEKFEIVDVVLPGLGNLHANPLRYYRGYRVIKEKTRDLDVIHERFHVNPVDLLFVKGKKYILEVNDPGIETWMGLRRYLYPAFVKRKFDKSDAIVTQTETLKRIIQRHTAKPVYVVPNGVDTDIFRPDVESHVRERYGVGEDEVLVTFTGSFREWHGVQDIPKIAEKIGREDVKFLLVGSGPLFHEVGKKCSKNENIILTGAKPPYEIPEFLAASDILIAPFSLSRFGQMRRHGFWWCPVKLFEYMASGGAIVASDFREVRKIVRDAALLAAPGDAADFAGKISLLMEDEKLRRSLGRRARKIAKNEYDWGRRVKRLVGIYGGV